MKEEILKLRAEGKSYKAIRKILGCSLGTIAYHCGDGQKEKYRKRQTKRRETTVISGRVTHFQHKRTKNDKDREVQSDKQKLLRHKSDDFQRREGCKKTKRCIEFTYKDVLARFGEKTTCYLTGKPIDLKEPRTYNFDHIIPAAKGGSNSLENLGIATREANNAKSDLTVEEFLQLCKEVLEHNGYTVTKNGA